MRLLFLSWPTIELKWLCSGDIIILLHLNLFSLNQQVSFSSEESYKACSNNF